MPAKHVGVGFGENVGKKLMDQKAEQKSKEKLSVFE